MRFSDWSSDVCSSDLKVFGLTRLAATIDKAEGALETLEPETIDYCKCVIEIVCKHILSERGIPYDDLKLPRLVKLALSSCGFEIGRASCWERGCQYV